MRKGIEAAERGFIAIRSDLHQILRPLTMVENGTRTAGFKRCDFLVVTYCSFPFIFVFDGLTDRRTDIFMSFF